MFNHFKRKKKTDHVKVRWKNKPSFEETAFSGSPFEDLS